MKKYLILFLLLITCLVYTVQAQSSTPSFPVGKTFLIRGYPMELNADKTYRTYNGSTINASGLYAIKGQTISLTDTAGLYMSKDDKGQRITGTYNWTYQEGKLRFTVIEDKADGRRTALLEAPLLPGDKEKEIIELILDYYKAYDLVDAKTVASTIHDTFEGVDRDFRIVNKNMVVSGIPSAPTGYTVRFPELKVRIVDETAIVTGTSVFSMKEGSTLLQSGEAFTTTMIRQDGRWQSLASRSVTLPDWRFRELADSELKPLKPLPCREQSTLKSLNNTIATFIRFSNTTDKPVTFTWINFEGKPQLTRGQSETLAPNKTSFRHTWVTHPFIITDSKGTCLGIYQPTAEPSIVVIGGK